MLEIGKDHTHRYHIYIYRDDHMRYDWIERAIDSIKFYYIMPYFRKIYW